MNWVDRLAGAITDHSREVIVTLLVVSTVVGAGAPAVEQSSSMDQFQSDTPESQKLDYVESNFTTGNENTTSVQIIVRDGNVLGKASLVRQLRFQQQLRANETINETLADERPTIGVANVIASAAPKKEQIDELRERGAELQNRSQELNESREDLQRRSTELNETASQLQAALDTLRENPNASVRAAFERVDANTSVDLTEDDYATFERAAAGIRSNTSAIGPAIQSGTQTILEDDYAALGERQKALNRTGKQLKEALDTLQRNRLASIREEFDKVNANTSVELTEQDYEEFEAAAQKLRRAVTPQTMEEAYREGTRGVLEDKIVELQERATALNETAPKIGASLSTVAQDQNASARAQFQQLNSNTSYDLDEDDWEDYQNTVEEIRALQANIGANYRLGTRGVLSERFEALGERGEELKAEGEALQEAAEQLQADREAFEENATSGEMSPPSEQIERLESMNQSEIDDVIPFVLGNGETNGSLGAAGGSSGGAGSSDGAFALMPTSYEPGSTSAEATMMVVTQRADDQTMQGMASEDVQSSQLAIQDQARDQYGTQNALVFGSGIITDEINRSMSDSLAIVGPLALLFVLAVLVLAYRDFVDILLGVLGIGLVLAWTFGFMGWTGIEFNQMFIAVPVLLIGLSIDYAIHVFMRHREERERYDGSANGRSPVGGSMKIALASVGVALTLVTATTVIGFLSNLTSSVPPIRGFGLVSAFGIVAALLVFGALIPALKVEVDDFLERRGYDREKRAFGTGGGRVGDLLNTGTTLARASPIAVIVVALLVSTGGAYGATQVDTSFSQKDFLAEEPPGWTENLPEPFNPGEYSAKSSLEYVNENFVREDSQAQILVEGAVTDPDALEEVQRGQDRAAESNVTVVLSNGEPDVKSPLTVMRSVASENETFNATFTAADTDGDGVPDRNLEGVYDALYETAPDRAATVVHRTDDDEYEALLLTVSLRGGASSDAVADQMRDVAATFDGGGLDATATGQPIVFKIVQDQLLDTVIQSLLITLVAVFAFLMLTYRITEGSATLGFVTLLPVVLSVSWILGTMYLAGIPFNVMTGMITSLTIGLGVAYSIHISERYSHELDRHGSIWEAMRTTVAGTGGALLGSAATTVGGFGVLVFAILPPLQQFGLITGLTIIYAFVGSVLVLPSMLAVWTRYAGPAGVFPEDVSTPGGTTPVAANGALGNSHLPAGQPTKATPQLTDGRPGGTPPTTDEPVVRTVEPGLVRPGQQLTGSVTLPRVSGRMVLREHAPVDEISIESVDPSPVDAVVDGQDIFVTWELEEPQTAALEYVATVPSSAAEGAELTFDCTVRTAEERQPITRTSTVEVVTDFIESILARGTVTKEDLRIASEALDAGEISSEQFERIHHEWLRHVTPPESDQGTSPALTGDDDDD